MAMVAERRGQRAEALPHLRRAASVAPLPFFEGVLIRGLRLAGETAEADARDAALAARGSDPATDFAVAIARLPLGQRDSVLPRLLSAAAARDQFALLVPLKVWWYDALRDDPRFADVAARLGLPPTAM
jgi:hypothetical protein